MQVHWRYRPWGVLRIVGLLGVVGAMACRGGAGTHAEAGKQAAEAPSARTGAATAPETVTPAARSAAAAATTPIAAATPATEVTTPTAATAPTAATVATSADASPAAAPSEAEVAKDAKTLAGGLPVPEALERRLRYQLRDLSPAPIALRETVLLPVKGGGAEVIGFTEYSVYEDCVQRFDGSRNEAREQCLPETTTFSDEGVVFRSHRFNRHCKRYGLFYAKVAAAAKLEKGALTLEHQNLPEEDCELVELKELRVADLDLDGRRELVLDVTFGREEEGDTRSGDDLIDKATMRYVWVLEVEPAWREQLMLPIGVRRVRANADVRWVDLNRDKRPDLVQVKDCNGNGGAMGWNDECDEPLRDRLWYLYDRELDTWRDPDAPAPAAAEPNAEREANGEAPAAKDPPAPEAPAEGPAPPTRNAEKPALPAAGGPP